MRMIAFPILLILLHQTHSELSKKCLSVPLTCPSGDLFYVKRCRVAFTSCKPCIPVLDAMRKKCPQYACARGPEDMMSEGTWHNRTNGCTAGVVSGMMNRLVGASCHMHDLCYSLPGISRLRCDKNFYRNMLQEALVLHGTGTNPWKRWAVRSAAGAAYAAVRGFAHMHVMDCRRLSRLVECGDHYAKECSMCPAGIPCSGVDGGHA